MTDDPTLSCGFHSNQLHALVRNKIVESANSVTSTTDTSDDSVRKFADFRLQLLLDLLSNDTLEVADNRREWMRANGRTDQIMSGGKIRYPVTHCFIHSVFECPRTRVYWYHLSTCQYLLQQVGVCAYFGPEHVNAEDVECLTTNILGTHVNDTLHAEPGANGSCRYTVLSCTSLSDDTLLANAAGQEDLPDCIVDLV